MAEKLMATTVTVKELQDVLSELHPEAKLEIRKNGWGDVALVQVANAKVIWEKKADLSY